MRKNLAFGRGKSFKTNSIFFLFNARAQLLSSIMTESELEFVVNFFRSQKAEKYVDIQLRYKIEYGNFIESVFKNMQNKINSKHY